MILLPLYTGILGGVLVLLGCALDQISVGLLGLGLLLLGVFI